MHEHRTLPVLGVCAALACGAALNRATAAAATATAMAAAAAATTTIPAAATAAMAAPPVSGPLASLPAAGAQDACEGMGGAYLRARLRGAASLDVSWHGDSLHCDGGLRPDGQGVRVSFNGSVPAHRLLFIFGIDTAPRRGAEHNVATNLTVIFEGERRLYSTGGAGRCSLDELTTETMPRLHGVRRLQLQARGFCIAPASALGGGAALLVSRFDFRGAFFLDQPETRGPSTGPAPR